MNVLIFLKNIIQLILAPSEGWRDIEKDDVPVEVIISRGLYPLMAIMLISEFIRPLYGIVDFNLVRLLQTALAQFVALFVAMYAGKTVMEYYLPSYNTTGENDPVAVGKVAVYGTGLMTVIQLIENLLPVELTIMQLLPALAAVCLWKADAFLDVEQKGEYRFMLITVAALILPVIVINVLMNLLIN